MKRNSIHIVVLVMGMSLGLMAATAVGELLTLQDKNSVVTIDTGGQAGVYDWKVNGVNQLSQQWFWYRIGEEGGEASIDTLGNPQFGTYRGTRGAFVSYSNQVNGLSVEVDYLLTGASISGKSDLGESVSITNNSTNPMHIHFFQYSDFDLNGDSGGDSLLFPNVNTVIQTKGALSLTETVVTPSPDRHEGKVWDNTLQSLNDNFATTLSNTPAIGAPAIGPGDMTWAFEWDRIIQPGDTFLISKDKQLNVVPEPSTLALLFGAGLGLVCYASRRRRS